MKNILILAYDFPPLNSIGAQRPFSWFSYMKDNGLNPIVVTIDWEKEIPPASNSSILNLENENIHRVSIIPTLRDQLIKKYGMNRFITIRKALSLLISITQYLPSSIGDNKYNIYKEAKKIIEFNKIDAIIATGEPFVLFKYAHKLAKKHNIKWYADYRDDWIEDHVKKQKSSKLSKIINHIESIIEKRLLSNVTGISSVSKELVNQINNRITPPFSIVIENGIDLSYIENAKKKLNDNQFNIVYTGIFYDCNYIDIFIKGFEMFLAKQNKKNVQLLFIGTEYQKNNAYHKIKEFSEEHTSIVQMIDRVDMQTAINYQTSAQVLLNFIAGDPSKGLIGAKAYSYAATRVPTLTVPHIANKNSPFFPNRDIQHIATTPNEISDFLTKTYLLYQKGKTVKTSITDEEIYLISREYQTKKLTEFIQTTIQ